MVTFLLPVMFIALVAVLPTAVSRKPIRFGKIKARIYEIKEDGTYEQMFKSLSSDLNKLCFTKSQIEQFVQQRPNWFHENEYLTLFLFKEDGCFHVARVYLVPGSLLKIVLHSFEKDHIWLANERRRCLVVPTA